MQQVNRDSKPGVGPKDLTTERLQAQGVIQLPLLPRAAYWALMRELLAPDARRS